MLKTFDEINEEMQKLNSFNGQASYSMQPKIKSFIDILEELQTTTGTNDKIALIKANTDNVELKEYLKLALSKDATFGIAEFTISEEKSDILTDLNMMWDTFVDICNSLINRKLTGNDARAIIDSFFFFTDQLQEKWFRKCLMKDLSCIGIGQRLYEKAYDEIGFKFRLGLAEEIGELDNAEEESGWLDLKANGVRTVSEIEDCKLNAIYGGRNGLLANNFYFIQEELEKLVAAMDPEWASVVFDGEMHVNHSLENTMTLYGFKIRPKDEFIGAKGKLKEKAWADYSEEEALVLKYKADAKYTIFDMIPLDNWNNQDYNKVQDDRKKDLEKLAALVKKLQLTRIEIIPTERVATKSDAIDAAQKWITLRFEGGIWKPGSGIYLWKRSRNWIKIKEVEDFEVKITGFEKQKAKYNSDGTPKPDMVGKVLAIDKNGNIHKIGTGKALSEKVREHMYNDPDYYIGKIGTCSAQRKSDKGGSSKYICPRLDVIRLDRDTLED